MKITKTASGKYTCHVCVGTDSLGRRRFKNFTDSNKTRLRQTVSEYLAEHRVFVESNRFDDVLQKYIDARERIKSPATIRGYKSIQKELKKQYPSFCALPCDRITDTDLQNLINDMISRDLSSKTVANYTGLIKSVIRSDHVTPPETIMPAKQRPEYVCPTVQDMKTLLELSRTQLKGRMEIPLVLATLGLRRGEICALTVDDVTDNTVHVHRSAVYEHGGKLVVKETPKTADSDRYVMIPADVADRIRAQGFVTDYTPEGLTEAFRRLCDANGMPHYRLHDCRHFFASYCHSKGVPEADILAAGGWRTGYVMRNVYRHAMSQNSAASKMNGFLAGIM